MTTQYILNYYAKNYTLSAQETEELEYVLEQYNDLGREIWFTEHNAY